MIQQTKSALSTPISEIAKRCCTGSSQFEAGSVVLNGRDRFLSEETRHDAIMELGFAAMRGIGEGWLPTMDAIALYERARALHESRPCEKAVGQNERQYLIRTAVAILVHAAAKDPACVEAASRCAENVFTIATQEIPDTVVPA